ncbi:SLC26A11.2 family protein [Megaselia abdita]
MATQTLDGSENNSTQDIPHFHGSSDFILTSSCDSTHYVSKRNKSYAQTCRDIFRVKTLFKRLPILTWLPRYTLDQGIGDFIAGITVGMTVIPQGLAYAGVAGLASEYGLYGSFMGCFMYVVFGSCQYITIGSTAVASLLVFQTAAGVWQRAVFLTFITGILELLMAFFQLSFLVDFVSGPVSAGFTSAVALIILTSQIKNIFGVNSEGSSFLDMWISIIKDIEHIHWNDTVMGVACIVFLISMKFIGAIKIGPKQENDKNIFQKIINKFIWLCGISRNAIVVVVCIYIGFWSESTGNNYFKLAGYIPAGLPEVKLPDFSIEEIRVNGTVVQEGETFFEMIQFLGSGLIVIPLIALLESFAACKAFAKGQSIDVTQELITVGLSNIANSFFQGYRANAGLARSAVNHASGARTPMSNFYIGVVVVLALLYLTPFFAYIPKACLAAIIISAVIFMVQYSVVKPMWRSKISFI